VFLIECRPTFQRYVLPPSSGPLWGGYSTFYSTIKRLIALMMEAARTSEKSVDMPLRTRQYIPEDSELRIQPWLLIVLIRIILVSQSYRRVITIHFLQSIIIFLNVSHYVRLAISALNYFIVAYFNQLHFSQRRHTRTKPHF
jgi:hypothetical protein